MAGLSADERAECAVKGGGPARSPDAPPAGKTFVFHTGFHKTGSTAMQAYLAHNADRLKVAGVAYVYPAGKAGSPGNGQHFFELMRKGNMTAS